MEVVVHWGIPRFTSTLISLEITAAAIADCDFSRMMITTDLNVQKSM